MAHTRRSPPRDGWSSFLVALAIVVLGVLYLTVGIWRAEYGVWRRQGDGGGNWEPKAPYVGD